MVLNVRRNRTAQRIVSTLYICTVSVKCYDSAVVPDDVNAGLLIPLVTDDDELMLNVLRCHLTY